MDVHPGLLSIIEKMLNEATSPESDSTYVNTRLKNDILVNLFLSILSRTKLGSIT